MIACDRLPGHSLRPTPLQLARALAGLGIHRGYKSNTRARRQTSKEDAEKLMAQDTTNAKESKKASADKEDKKQNLAMITHLEQVLADPKNGMTALAKPPATGLGFCANSYSTPAQSTRKPRDFGQMAHWSRQGFTPIVTCTKKNSQRSKPIAET